VYLHVLPGRTQSAVGTLVGDEGDNNDEAEEEKR
jgi:hypothetical protein